MITKPYGAFLIQIVLLALFSFAPTPPAYSTCPGQESLNEEACRSYVPASELIFTAEIASADTVCIDGQSRAYVQVDNVDPWWGIPPKDIPIRVVQIQLPSCSSVVDSSLPLGFAEGQRYFFACGRDWSWDAHKFLNELYVPVQGLLCINEAGQFDFCTEDYNFTFTDPALILERACQTISLVQQMADADLVVVAHGFQIPGQTNQSNRSQAKNGTQCLVSSVLKGDPKISPLKFNIHANPSCRLGWVPMTSIQDVALLFLSNGPTGLGLLHGSKSFFLLQENVIYNNHGLPMGAMLEEGKIVGHSGREILNLD